MFLSREMRCLFFFLVVAMSWLPENCVADDEGAASDDGGAAADVDGQEGSGGGEAEACEPALADECFDDMLENLLCHLLSPVGRNCTMRNARDLCVGFDDALNCTSGIIDSSCSEKEGRLTFDTWLIGLRAVELDLCQGEALEPIQVLLDNTRCWSFKKFISCIETEANIMHVSDLLTTDLDAYECNRLQLAVGVCNAKAEKNRWFCKDKAEVLHRALAVFFSATNCGALTSSCRSLKLGGTTGATVLSTLVVMAVLLALLGIFLVRKGVLALNSTRRRHEDPLDSDGPQEDYSRLT
ncbi:uncharacterized protein [Penaeus vannamei]|uniref:uncharacterized protein n=1 Tax=Penaeus vannamei TaxID=6689 RepID=UPI000F67B1D5|nr:uncharacterized protein LOC113810969 [Penaeus vannamei]